MKAKFDHSISRRLLSALLLGVMAGMPAVLQAISLDTFSGDGSVSAPSAQQSLSFAAPQAIGGARTLSVERISGQDPALEVRIRTVAGLLTHSQDTTVVARSTVIWDGDQDPSSIHPNGLGRIDLTQDGGNAIVLEDVQADRGTTFTVTLYDADDALGNRYLQVQDVHASEFAAPTVELPFAQFKPFGGATSDTLKHVGAISLGINGGNSDLDVRLSGIRTNGMCSILPDVSGRVIDECGVCGGHNENQDSCGVCYGNNAAKDSCGVCFGHNAALDRCGVCFGNNKDLDDCGVCGGKNASKDQCGVCGGDGKSCLDCAGVPHGSKQPDSCGRCGGDGTSCNVCTSIDTSSAVVAAKTCIATQARYAAQVADHAGDTASVLKSHAASARAKKLLTTLQTSSIECKGKTCTSVAINKKAIAQLGATAKSLFSTTLGFVGERPAGDGSGKLCRGTVAECRARLMTALRQRIKLRTFARRYYNKSVSCIKKLPTSTTLCQ